MSSVVKFKRHRIEVTGLKQKRFDASVEALVSSIAALYNTTLPPKEENVAFRKYVDLMRESALKAFGIDPYLLDVNKASTTDMGENSASELRGYVEMGRSSAEYAREHKLRSALGRERAKAVRIAKAERR